jgi:hypothetical protein
VYRDDGVTRQAKGTLAQATDAGLQVSSKAVYKVRDLLGASVRRVGKFIDGHPRRPRRNTGISREQMLMEVMDSEAYHRDVHTLCAFGPQRDGDGSRGASH